MSFENESIFNFLSFLCVYHICVNISYYIEIIKFVETCIGSTTQLRCADCEVRFFVRMYK